MLSREAINYNNPGRRLRFKILQLRNTHTLYTVLRQNVASHTSTFTVYNYRRKIYPLSTTISQEHTFTVNHCNIGTQVHCKPWSGRIFSFAFVSRQSQKISYYFLALWPQNIYFSYNIYSVLAQLRASQAVHKYSRQSANSISRTFILACSCILIFFISFHLIILIFLQQARRIY